MNKKKILALLLLVLAIATGVGMVIENDAFWTIHNYFTILLSVVSGIVLLRQK